MIDILHALIESTDRAGTADEWETEICEAEDLITAWNRHCSAQHAEQREVYVGTRLRVTRSAPDAVTLKIDGKDHPVPLDVARALAAALGYVSGGER